jgi:hypothetical protein
MSRALKLERTAGVSTVLRRSIPGTSPSGLGSRVLFQTNTMKLDTNHMDLCVEEAKVKIFEKQECTGNAVVLLKYEIPARKPTKPAKKLSFCWNRHQTYEISTQK